MVGLIPESDMNKESVIVKDSETASLPVDIPEWEEVPPQVSEIKRIISVFLRMSCSEEGVSLLN